MVKPDARGCESAFLAYAVYYTSLLLLPVAKVSAAVSLSPPVTMLWAWMLFRNR